MDIITGIIDNADKLTVAGVLGLLAAENAYLVYAFIRKKIVPGWAYDAQEEELSRWRDIGLVAIPTLKEVVTKK